MQRRCGKRREVAGVISLPPYKLVFQTLHDSTRLVRSVVAETDSDSTIKTAWEHGTATSVIRTRVMGSRS